MSTRYNTGNQIESTDVRDMSDNAKNFDLFSGSELDTFVDRLGETRLTIEGAIEKSGFKPGSGDFVTGFTVMPGMRNISWKNPSPPGDNNFYSWDGPIPPTGKFVPAGSTPETTGGVIAGAWRLRTDVTLRGELAEDSGAALVNTIQPVPGAIKRAVMGALRERISLLDFMTPAQRDAVYSGANVDHQSAFTKAMAWLVGGKKTLEIPFGTYNFTDTFDIPIGSCVYIDPKALLNFTSTTTHAIRIRRGVVFHGNMAKLRMTNPAWDGIAVYFNGEDQFTAEEPCCGSGLDINSAAYKKGTAIHLEALGPRDYVMFVNMSNWTFGFNLNYGITLNAGSSGTSAPDTWHWINSNTFSDISSSAFHLISLVGLSTTPAEIAGNCFLNVHHQAYDGSGLPVYFSGGHNNTLTGFIWDWDNSVSSPVVFEGGAAWNNIHTNVDILSVKTNGGVDAFKNKVFDLTGGELGQKNFFGPVAHLNQVSHGVVGTAGQYAQTYAPDAYGGTVFSSINDGATLSFAAGHPYSSPLKSLHLRGDGTVVVGSDPSNSIGAAHHIKGAPYKHASAIKIGTDGFGGVVLENAAGAQVGYITINASSVIFSTTSDYRLKDEIAPVVGSGNFIDSLHPVSWKWKLDGTSGVGFIAHELQAVSPSSVNGEKDAVQEVIDENGNGTGAFVPLYQSVEYGSAEVIANLVAEVQSLRARLLSLGV